MKLVGVAMVVFGILQILFRSAFSRFDMRIHEWIHRRIPALYALPGMHFRLDARLQVATTVMFGVFFAITGVAIVVWASFQSASRNIPIARSVQLCAVPGLGTYYHPRGR